MIGAMGRARYCSGASTAPWSNQAVVKVNIIP